jgi:tetratricopeptide (TPR) repeat protein
MRFVPLACCIVLAVVVARPASGQKDKKEPSRPHVPIGVDTNDAQVYYDLGLAQLERDPKKAADAFFWAARLNPTGADAYYARRIALLLSDPRRLQRYWYGDRGTVQSDEIKRIDSLQLQALTINPFLSQRLDARLLKAIIDQIANDEERRTGASANEISYYLETWLMRAPVSMRAWRAYGNGDFREALSLYAEAIKSAKRKASLRTDRGRIFFQLDQADSALAELTLAVEEMRKSDKKDLVFLYESKALTEHSIGMIHHRLGNMDAAKEAFGRALQEDLSYSPAHVQLGFLALETKDTTTALSELDLAVQIRGDDPGLRYIYGFVLAMASKHAESEEHLRKAIALDPVYALPHYVLGQVLEVQGKRVEAATEYRAFLAMASRQDPRRAEATDALKALTAAGSGS